MKKDKTPIWAIIFWPVAIAAFLFGSHALYKKLSSIEQEPPPDPYEQATPAPRTPPPPPIPTPTPPPVSPRPSSPTPEPATPVRYTAPTTPRPTPPPTPPPITDSTELAKFKADVIRRIEVADDVRWDAELKALARERVNSMIGLVYVAKITFASGTELDQNRLNEIRDALQAPKATNALAQPNAGIVILGYADPTGSPDANAKLSKDRALAVEKHVRNVTQKRWRTFPLGVGQTDILNTVTKENRAVEIWIAIQPPGSE